MKEPPRNNDLESLVPYVRDRVLMILIDLKKLGYKPVVFEARRSPARQLWLYGVGRWHSKARSPVTHTLLSKHIVGKAADIIEKDTLWSDPKFFRALDKAAKRAGMAHPFAWDQAHIEWRG